jgi:hypothetical protein
MSTTTDHRCTFYCCPVCHTDLRAHETPCRKARTFRATGFSGGGRLYQGTDVDDAIAAARKWACDNDAGAIVRDVATAESIYEQAGLRVLRDTRKA